MIQIIFLGLAVYGLSVLIGPLAWVLLAAFLVLAVANEL